MLLKWLVYPSILEPWDRDDDGLFRMPVSGLFPARIKF